MRFRTMSNHRRGHAGRPRTLIAAAVTMFVAGAAAAAVAIAADRVSFTDPPGDSGNGPDISAVRVSNDNRGNLTIAVELANDGPIRAGVGGTIVALDTDRNAATGDPGPDEWAAGADYLLIGNGAPGVDRRPALARFNASTQNFDFGFSSSLTVTYRSGPTYRINARDLAAPRAFRFAVITSGHWYDPSDVAPDAGKWEYALSPYVVEPLRLTIARVETVPVRPSASAGRFEVRLHLRRSDTRAPISRGTVKCAATVDGRRVVYVASFRGGGVASCFGGIPRWARGKQLRLVVMVAHDGASIRRTLTYRVSA